MPKGLAISDVVNVRVWLSPLSAGYRNFGAAIIVGDSSVIDQSERFRQYSNLEQVAADFGVHAPEFKAAELHFSQIPQSNLLYIGRWVRTNAPAILHGRSLGPIERRMSAFDTITDGGLNVMIDGVANDITGINLATCFNLNAVAYQVTKALQTQFSGATCTWDALANRFDITTGSTGGSASISYASGPLASGVSTNLALAMGLDNTVDTPQPILGIDGELPVDAVDILQDKTAAWYALEWACAVAPTDEEYIDVSLLIEGLGIRRIHGITTMHSGNKNPLVAGSLSEQLKDLGLNSTFVQYSSTNPYAVASLWSRFSTINYEENNSVITGKFKQEPGVAAEYLSESEAQTLKNRNCNMFVAYQNDTAITQEGVMSGGWYIDERVSIDWLQNALQTDIFNLLYTTPNKVPQNDAGTHMITTVITNTMERSVNNGFIGPGQWNGPPLGQVATGDALDRGYYIFAPLVSTQSQSDREARKSVPITILAKCQGAIHSVDVMCYVER